MNTARTGSKLTYAHYVLFPDDGRRHEIIDGDHVVNPAPSPRHQAIVLALANQLLQRVQQPGLGQVFVSPIDVELSPHDIVQPDLVLILKEHREIITPKKIKGAPDLIVEVLSDSSEQLDRTLKRELYQRAGVPEYWIVDPGEQEAEQYVLGSDGYRLHQHSAETLRLQVLPEVGVELGQVWRSAAGL